MAIRSEIYTQFYSGDVVVKLAVARELHSRFGRDLLHHPGIRTQLTAVQADERALQEQMAAMEMGATCTQCASRPGGGCCSRYMAGENDVPQLLMNLLAGVEVAIQQDGDKECCFLGPTGCVLALKPMFCLNYNCVHIKEKAESESLRLLEQRTGVLLTRQAVLEQLLLDFFCEKL